ncbi:cytochrome P450 81Q32-like [Vitis vinifera]|uniref:Isoflavone 2'-hydroxylase n=3 Tax=Vitis vinifera TaxID=29760 RepID=F6HXB1_VITVI|nr:cytochrome P450 81Q32-like [Vitis vinifera]RVW81653.1 Isoflavone 2'-hydroxylase [Vitis vinifera]
MEAIYLCLPFFLALYLFTRHWLQKLKNLPPSPFLTFPIIGHLYLLKKPLHRTLADLSARYGPIVFLRLGSRQTLLVSSPSAAEECLSKNDVVFANRPQLLAGKYIGYNYTSMAWANYGDHWRNLRRISALEILSTSRIQMLSGIRSDEVRSLLLRLLENGTETVDMKTTFFEVTMNVMMRMIAGKRYYGGNVVEVEETAKFQEIIEDTFRLGDTTNIGDYLPVLRWLGVKGKEKGLRELQRKRDRFMQGLIEEHRTRMAKESYSSSSCRAGEKKKTMIEVLLSLQEKEAEYYTDEIIRGLMLALLGAGIDTTSATLEWAMSLLLNNPEVLKKAQMEMDNQLGPNHLIEESDLSQLPYLHCIIRETQRMYPAGPIVPHESSKECMVGGYHIPRGTMLLVNIWGIQNDPEVWKEPRKFLPERFEVGLEGEGHGLRLMPFGSGRRGCPGEGLAIRMVGLVLGSLIQCFDWKRVGEGKVDMSEGIGLTLPRAQPLLAKCRPRPALINLLSQI